MMPPLYYRRHLFRAICLILSLYIMGIKLDLGCDVYACWRKMLKEECLLAEPSWTCNFKSSDVERENEYEESVSIENNNSLYKRCANFCKRFQLV
jgi:hypothetical protein